MKLHVTHITAIAVGTKTWSKIVSVIAVKLIEMFSYMLE